MGSHKRISYIPVDDGNESLIDQKFQTPKPIPHYSVKIKNNRNNIIQTDSQIYYKFPETTN